MFAALAMLLGVQEAPGHYSPRTAPGHSIIRETQGLEKQEKRDLFLRLLGTKNDALSWPGFPRYWYEESISENVEEITRVGLNTSVIPGTAINITPLEVKFRYSLKSSFILVATTRKGGNVDIKTLEAIQNDVSKSVSSEPLNSNDPLSLDVFSRDSNFNLYPNPKPGFPMVGVCYYEVIFNFDQGATIGFDVMGSGVSRNTTKTKTISLSLYSNFFQVDGSMSVNDWSGQVCQETFTKIAKPKVLELLTPTVIRARINESGLSECLREKDYKPQPKVTDAGCERKQNINEAYNPKSKGTFVQRCELWSDGVNRCTTRKNENESCTMYYNHKTKAFTDKMYHRYYDENSQAKSVANEKITESFSWGECDSGLKCTLDVKPWMPYGLLVKKGAASCKKIKP